MNQAVYIIYFYCILYVAFLASKFVCYLKGYSLSIHLSIWKEGLQIQDSPEALRCVLKQDTFSSA